MLTCKPFCDGIYEGAIPEELDYTCSHKKTREKSKTKKKGIRTEKESITSAKRFLFGGCLVFASLVNLLSLSVKGFEMDS